MAVDARTAERLERYLVELGGFEARVVWGMRVKVTRGEPLPVVSRAVHREVGAIIADVTGASARTWLRRTTHKGFAALVRRAAFVAGRGFADLRARRTVALGALLTGCAVRTRRKGRWRYLVEGVPLPLIRWMLRDPWQRPASIASRGVPSQGALTGTYAWGGTWTTARAGVDAPARPGCGIVTALRQLGAIYSPDNAGTPKKFFTPSGYQPNQYWILTDVVEHVGAWLASLVDEAQASELDEHNAPPRFCFTTGPP